MPSRSNIEQTSFIEKVKAAFDEQDAFLKMEHEQQKGYLEEKRLEPFWKIYGRDYTKGERPDFKASIDNSTWGIEVVSTVNQDRRSRDSKFAKWLDEYTQSVLLKKRPKGLKLYVSLKDDAKFMDNSNKTKQALFREIEECLEENENDCYGKYSS